MTKTPSQLGSGSWNRYSWQRFQKVRAGPISRRLLKLHELVDGDGLVLALDADQVEFAEDKARLARGGAGGFAREDVRAEFLVEAFQARGQVYGIAHGSVAVAKLRAHVTD